MDKYRNRRVQVEKIGRVPGKEHRQSFQAPCASEESRRTWTRKTTGL